MRMYPKEFPPSRRRMPKRRAERQVFEALADSPHRGFVYYEWRRGYGRPELDFAIWMVGLGRIALQVKGGKYRLMDGDWYLVKRNGIQPVATSPLDEVWLEALELHDDIEDRVATFYNPFVIPVLVFPDMTEPDEAIESLARRKGVYVAWGTGNLISGLERIVRSRSVSDRLTMERIAAEVLAVTDGQIRLDAAVEREIGKKPARSSVLSLTVGGRSVLRVRAKEMRLRIGTRIDAEEQP